MLTPITSYEIPMFSLFFDSEIPIFSHMFATEIPSSLGFFTAYPRLPWDSPRPRADVSGGGSGHCDSTAAMSPSSRDFTNKAAPTWEIANKYPGLMGFNGI